MNIFTPRAQVVLQLTVPTFAANIWTSDAWDGKKYNVIAGSIFANQASDTDLFKIQQSQDGTNWDQETVFTVSASTTLDFSINLVGRYVRFYFKHAGVAPTVFRLGAWGKVADTNVDVASVIPGTAATNLGKAEDAAHATGDTGVMALGVRKDSPVALAADGDYTPQQMDALGNVRVVQSGVPMFGEPTLLSRNNGDAVWSRPGISPYFQKSVSGWLANLYGGVQSGWDDFAAIYIPVNELKMTDLSSALWTYFMTEAEAFGVNMVIWAHDPADNDKRAEITQLGSVAGLEKAQGWNAHKLVAATDQFFFYGEGISGNDVCTDAGPPNYYGLDDFQADALFSTWTIYRISFEYGWHTGDNEFKDAWVADIKINGQVIPLKPDSGGSGRIGRRHFEQVGAGALAGVLAPKTPFRLLSIDVHASAVLDTGEDLTLTKDAGKGTSFDTVLFSEDLFVGSRTSYFGIFGEGFDFADNDEIDLAQANGSGNIIGVTLNYQTVFA